MCMEHNNKSVVIHGAISTGAGRANTGPTGNVQNAGNAGNKEKDDRNEHQDRKCSRHYDKLKLDLQLMAAATSCVAPTIV